MNLSQGPSNVEHILSTNAVPNALEAASIQHGIDDLTSGLCQKRAELEAMENQLRRHKAALSPIRRTPPEIVAQIIRFVAWGVLHSRGRQHLVWLSLVCKSWREAAMLCHEQWKGIHIEENNVCEPGAFEKIVSWRGGRQREMQIHEPHLIKLLKEGPILDHFFLRISKPSCLFKLFDAIGARNPTLGVPRPWANLRSLILDFSGLDSMAWDDAEQAADSFFNYLPQVASLSLYVPDSYAVFEEDSSAARSASIHLPPSLLANLTSFEIKCDWEGSHVLKMLGHCPQLETLGIDLFGNDLVHDDTDPLFQQAATTRLLFPQLHTLKLESQKTLCALGFLKAPALRSLYIDIFSGTAGRQVDWEFCKTFDLFIKESNCRDTLRSLELTNIHVKTTGLGESIVGLRSLERLVLSRMPVLLNQLLWSLGSRVREVAGSNDEPGLPHLEELVLLKVPNHIASGALLDFVQSLPASRLHLTVSYDYPSRSKPPTETQFVEQLQGTGASVRVILDEMVDWYASPLESASSD